MKEQTKQAQAGSLLDVLGSSEWDSLRRHMARHAYEPGDVLVHQGAVEPDFQVIVEGVASISATSPLGQHLELARLGPGDSIGEMSLLTGEPASAQVTAWTHLEAYVIPAAKLVTLDPEWPQLTQALSAILATRLGKANDRLLSMHTAKVQVVCCSPSDVSALSRLPGELAQVASARVLVMTVGDHFESTGLLDAFAGRNVSVIAMGTTDSSELRNRIHLLEQEYDQIILFGAEETFRELEDEVHSFLRVQPEDHPDQHAGDGSTVVVTEKPWTRAVIQQISSALDQTVVGVLPPESPSPGPRDPVAKLARVLGGQQVGIALGAGGAKGFAHLGVLRALEELGTPIDVISGCSIGAAIGAGWAAGLSADELAIAAKRIGSRAIRPTIPLHSLLSNRGIRDELKRLGAGKRFEDLDIPLALVATDIYRRCEVTFTSGVVWPAILASMAIPGIYPPIRARRSYLVDGGVLSPVPAQQARALGAGIVIGVRLTGKSTSPTEELDFTPSRPLVAETMTRSLEIMNNRISEFSKDQADVTIEVCLDGGGIGDFNRGDEYMEAGYKATMEAAEMIRAVLPYLKGVA